MSKEKQFYDSYGDCPVCGNDQDIKVIDRIEYTTAEVSLQCFRCGFEDYWAYGHLESTAQSGRWALIVHLVMHRLNNLGWKL